MISEFVNGYLITGNHGNTVDHPERLYHVEDASGTIWATANTKIGAIGAAEGFDTGDVPEPVAEQVVEAVKPAAAIEETFAEACVKTAQEMKTAQELLNPEEPVDDSVEEPVETEAE